MRLGRLLVEFLGYWMAEGWLAGGGGGLLGCWLGGWLDAGIPEPRNQGQGKVSGLFLEAQKHQFHIETVTITTEPHLVDMNKA